MLSLEMGGEVCNLLVDWSIALTSLLYSHCVGMFIAQGYCHKDELRIHPLLATSFVAYYFLFMLVAFFAVVAFLVRALIPGVELEPQFDEPHYATSVQDFWGKRWNLMVSDILRAAVYRPARVVFSRLVPERWVSVPSVFVTFLVSGIMHEMIFYYLGQVKPTWEVTWFFVINGVMVGIEIVMKKSIDLKKFERSPIACTALTWVFLSIPGLWLLFPPFVRLDPCVRVCKEAMAFVRLVKHGHLINPNELACPISM
ncbi:hypothetical protein L6452_04255 [Arctium lappa]|uniref:Uncharacterized protein n=1 Tax=Arctium lappa TaxID=4217 RepID=A0ACB9FPF5_ARCLA|nr:hypothetical protein L6452_04255 [Arctium lappa]